MCLKTAHVASEDVWGIMLTWRGRSLVHVHTARALFFIILIILKARLKNSVIQRFGEIENWDVSRVTSMENLFYLDPYSKFTTEKAVGYADFRQTF